jgi:hypothetical protein
MCDENREGRMKRTFVIVLLAVFCMSFSAHSQNSVPQITTSQGNRWLKGIITYTDNTPVVGARINISNPLLERNKSSVTGKSGEYSFTNLKAVVEPAIIIVTTDNATYEFEYIKTNQEYNLLLTKADRFLSGKVVDEKGNPLKDYGLSILPKKSLSGLTYLGWSTNDQGIFRKEGIAGEKVTVEVVAPEVDGTYLKYKKFENISTNQDHTFILGANDRIVWPLPVSPSEKGIKENEIRLKEILTKLIDTKVPELIVDKWVNTDPITISKLKGKNVILHFWSINNEGSAKRAIFISMLKEEYTNRGVEFIGIHEYTSNSDSLLEFIKKNKLGQRIAIDQKSSDKNSYGKSFDLYGVARMTRPDYISIDKNGNATDFYRDDELEQAIIDLLANK